jgi:aldose 1-epimerase
MNRQTIEPRRIHLKHGHYTAAVSHIGATLQTLTHRGRDLILGFIGDAPGPHYRGAILAPWPNRVAQGCYDYQGDSYELEINDPANGAAIHGLAFGAAWEVVHQTPSEVTLRHQIESTPGYPFSLQLTATYALSEAGLHWIVSAVNGGKRPAPYGVGPHPYLRAGDGSADDWRLELPAKKVFEGVTVYAVAVPVGGSIADFSHGRSLQSLVLDDTFTDLATDSSGMTRARLLGRDGGVELVWDPAECPWVQVYTYDHKSDVSGRDEDSSFRTGVAIEPMTCPPYAFNTGTDVISLQPGQRHSTSWQLSALP